MNTLRIAVAAAAFAAFGVVQASEITNFPLETSTKSRAEVQAEARNVRSAPGELYDGRQLTDKAAASTRSREEVRMEARVARAKVDTVMQNDVIGGM